MHLPALLPSLPCLLLQAVLPLALLGALAVRTPASSAGFWAHVAATALLLLAAALAGQWTALPWWTPLVLASALLAVGAGLYGARAGLPARQRAHAGARRSAPTLRWPPATGARLHFATCVLLGIASLATCAEALRAHAAAASASDHPTIDLQFPLPAGDYLVLEGGASRLLNAHRRALDGAAMNGTADAIDLVRLDDAGLRASAPWPQDPRAYFIHGTKVLSPCDGTVQAVRDGLPDAGVPASDTRQPLGNQVVLRCGAASVTLAHLRAGSVRVRAGEQVTVATPLAEVGNSGSVPEPVLHVHSERNGAPLRMRFDGRALSRNDRVSVAPPPAPR